MVYGIIIAVFSNMTTRTTGAAVAGRKYMSAVDGVSAGYKVVICSPHNFSIHHLFLSELAQGFYFYKSQSESGKEESLKFQRAQ